MLRLVCLLFLACLLAEMSLVDAFRGPSQRRFKRPKLRKSKIKVKPAFPPEREIRIWHPFEGDINIGESFRKPFPKFFLYQFRTTETVEKLKARLEGVNMIYKLMVRGANMFFIVVANEGVGQPEFELPHDAIVQVTPLMTLDQFMDLMKGEPVREERLVQFPKEQLILQDRWFPGNGGLNGNQIMASLSKIHDMLSQIEPRESCVHFVTPIQIPFRFMTLMRKDQNVVFKSFKMLMDIFDGGKVSSYVVEQF